MELAPRYLALILVFVVGAVMGWLGHAEWTERRAEKQKPKLGGP